MANDREIVIRISADGTAAIAGIRGVGDATGDLGNRTTSVTQSLKSNWLAVAGGITAAYLALGKIWDTMEAAAQLQERMENLDRLTSQYGTTAEGLVGVISANSRGLIGMKDAAEVATDALSKGFTPEQIARMSKYAETLADTSAQTMTTSEAFRTMEQALIGARERGVMRMFGATIDLEAALGKQVGTMTKAEKVQALYTLAMEAAEKRQKALGEGTDSAADRMERFTNSLAQAKFFAGQLILVIGQPLMAVFNVALTFAYGLAGGILAVVATIARLTDELGVTQDRADEIQKRSDRMFTSAATQALQAKENLAAAFDQLKNLGSLSSGAKGAGGLGSIGGDAGENQKQLDKLLELMRKYAAEREEINGAALDRELIKLNAWYDEQTQALKDLNAGKEHYLQLYAVYSDKFDATALARAAKIAEEEMKVWEERRDASIKLEAERVDRMIEEDERLARHQGEMRIATAAAYGTTETDQIRMKAELEQRVLDIRAAGVLMKITDEMTEQEIFSLLEQSAAIHAQIATLKEKEVNDLDARRVVLEREITDLKRQQRDLLFEQDAARTQEAFSKIGGAEFGQNLGVVSAINEGQDQYTKDFEQWSALQDQKIMYLEEIGASEQQIKDAYREYDLQQEAMVNQQKIAMASATFGMLGSLATSLYNLQGQKGGAAFELMKAYRIGETAMNTYSAAVGAYNAMASIPIVGPALGAAAAAAAIAFGMAQVNAIRSMKPGGGVTGSVSAGVPSLSSVTSAPAAKEESKPTPIVNVHIYGNVVSQDEFAREIIPYITKAVSDGAQ
jgi:hypothetical protein